MITELSRAQKQRMTGLRPWLSVLVISYVILGNLAGLACLLSSRLALHVLGILLLVHSTVLSGLLNHEFMHRAVFRSARTNDWAGAVMAMFNGACYVPFELLRRQHIAHHVHKVGYDGFSITRWVRSLSAPADGFCQTEMLNSTLPLRPKSISMSS